MSEKEIWEEIARLKALITNPEDPGYSTGPWTPAWTASGSAPAINDGTLTGHWVASGKLIVATINMTIGAGTGLGTGIWYFSLPFAEAYACRGSASVYDSNLTTEYGGLTLVTAGTKVYCLSGSDYLGVTVPFTWAVNDIFTGTIAYIAA